MYTTIAKWDIHITETDMCFSLADTVSKFEEDKFPSLRRTRRGSICDMSNKVSQLSYNETILLEDGITSLTSNCKIIYTEEGEDNDIVTGDRSAQKNFYLVI